MFDATKTDHDLGRYVNRVLKEVGVETPLLPTTTTNEEKIDEIQTHVTAIMQALGLDLADDSLAETPRRIAKMYVKELMWGLDYHNFPKATVIENKMGYTNMLVERHIKVVSECEHHFCPFIGEAFVAYIPGNKIIGLSKLNRVVEFFSRRPQVQERLTEQIYYTLSELLGTPSVAVVIKAQHTCVKIRGVEDINSDTITSRLGGAFLEKQALRDEFYQAIQL